MIAVQTGGSGAVFAGLPAADRDLSEITPLFRSSIIGVACIAPKRRPIRQAADEIIRRASTAAIGAKRATAAPLLPRPPRAVTNRGG